MISELFILLVQGGGGLNIKMSFYQYMDPHVKDKTVLKMRRSRHCLIFSMGFPVSEEDCPYT